MNSGEMSAGSAKHRKTKAVLERELTEAQGVIAELQEQVRKIAARGETQGPANGETPKGGEESEVGSPRASYRMDVYLSDGKYRGRIEHPLTRDREVFSDLDRAAIISFVRRHLPSGEATDEEATPSVAATAAHDPDASPLAEGHGRGAASESPSPAEIKVVAGQAETSTAVLQGSQPFDVVVDLRPAGAGSSETEVAEHAVTVYAKPLSSRAHVKIGETHAVLRSPERSTFRMSGKPLPAGTYRLEAFDTVTEPSGSLAGRCSAVGTSLLHVS